MVVTFVLLNYVTCMGGMEFIHKDWLLEKGANLIHDLKNCLYMHQNLFFNFFKSIDIFNFSTGLSSIEFSNNPLQR